MDIGLFIVIMIVMYVVPEILKRFKQKKPYQYPEFSPPTPTDGQDAAGMPGELSRGMRPPPLPLVGGEGTPGDEGDPAWQKKVDDSGMPRILTELPALDRRWELGGVAQGLIWAEIIAPPVSLRPIRHGMRRL